MELLVDTYEEFSEYLFEEIFDTIGNEPTVFPFSLYLLQLIIQVIQQDRYLLLET